MILRKGNAAPVSFGNKPRYGAHPVKTDEVCKHGFPHGTTRVPVRFRKADGTMGFGMKDIAEDDHCPG